MAYFTLPTWRSRPPMPGQRVATSAAGRARHCSGDRLRSVRIPISSADEAADAATGTRTARTAIARTARILTVSNAMVASVLRRLLLTLVCVGGVASAGSARVRWRGVAVEGRPPAALQTAVQAHVGVALKSLGSSLVTA